MLADAHQWASATRLLLDPNLTVWSGGTPAQGQRIGYVRVNTFEQNTQRQLDQVPVDRLFTGKDAQRPELESLLAFVREGDTVVVHSMYRLACNLDDLRSLVQKLVKRGIRIEFIKEHVILTGEDSPMATLMLSVTGAPAIAAKVGLGE